MPGKLDNYFGIKEDLEIAFNKEVDIVRLRDILLQHQLLYKLTNTIKNNKNVIILIKILIG